MNANVQADLAEGLAYERFMGRWSNLTGQLFVDWLEIAPQRDWPGRRMRHRRIHRRHTIVLPIRGPWRLSIHRNNNSLMPSPGRMTTG